VTCKQCEGCAIFLPVILLFFSSLYIHIFNRLRMRAVSQG